MLGEDLDNLIIWALKKEHAAACLGYIRFHQFDNLFVFFDENNNNNKASKRHLNHL